MNKKILTIISVVVLSLTLAVSWAFTASASNRNAKGYGECQQGVTGQSYVDDNNDGVCDNRTTQCATTCQATTTTTTQNADEDTDITASATTTTEKVTGPNYTDEDNDGVCDNIGSTRVPPQDGTGRQNGQRNGKNR